MKPKRISLAEIEKKIGPPAGVSALLDKPDNFVAMAVAAFALKVKGYSLSQIADGLGVSYSRASNLLAAVKRSYSIVRHMKEAGFDFEENT